MDGAEDVLLKKQEMDMVAVITAHQMVEVMAGQQLPPVEEVLVKDMDSGAVTEKVKQFGIKEGE
jgi:hypothetical protein